MIKQFAITSVGSALLASATPVLADAAVGISFDDDAELSIEELEATAALAQCIVREHKGLAKKFVRKKGNEKLRYLGPLLAPPCKPHNGTQLNVPALEAKMQELLNA